MQRDTWKAKFTTSELKAWSKVTKVCPSCQRLLAVLDCFGLVRIPYRNRTRIIARAYCHKCDSRKRRERFRRNNPQKWLAYLERFRTDADLQDPVKKRARIKAWRLRNRERVLMYYKAYRERHKDRHLARMMALHAYPVAQVCEVAQCDAMGVRHHDDYSKPLEIRWLCRKHHLEADRERRNRNQP